MEMVSELFKDLFNVWKEMFNLVLELLPKFTVLLLWIISGIIILPCVFIAGTFYPKWTEWGEKL